MGCPSKTSISLVDQVFAIARHCNTLEDNARPNETLKSLKVDLFDARMFLRSAEGIIDIPVGEGKIGERFRMTLRCAIKLTCHDIFNQINLSQYLRGVARILSG